MLSQVQCGLVQPALLRILAAVPDGVRGNNRRVRPLRSGIWPGSKPWIRPQQCLNDGVAPSRCLYCFHRSILLILLNPNNSTLLWFISISCIKRLVVVYAIQGYYASHKSLVSCLG